MKMDEVQRFTELKEKIEKLSSDKIRLEERFKNEREKLEKLVKEITAKGYDPTKLAEIKAEKEKELEKSLSDLEEKVEKVSENISKIEALND